MSASCTPGATSSAAKADDQRGTTGHTRCSRFSGRLAGRSTWALVASWEDYGRAAKGAALAASRGFVNEEQRRDHRPSVGPTFHRYGSAEATEQGLEGGLPGASG